MKPLEGYDDVKVVYTSANIKAGTLFINTVGETCEVTEIGPFSIIGPRILKYVKAHSFDVYEVSMQALIKRLNEGTYVMLPLSVSSKYNLKVDDKVKHKSKFGWTI